MPFILWNKDTELTESWFQEMLLLYSVRPRSNNQSVRPKNVSFKKKLNDFK